MTTTTEQRASERITAEVTSWDGIKAGPGTRGELSFRYRGREIGHLHGDHAAHFFFPEARWEELVAQGRIAPHPVFPERRGPAARQIESDADAQDVIALLRVNYDDAVERFRRADERRGRAG